MNETIIHLPFDVPLLPVKELRAGSLQCLYERGNLRYICFGGAEVLRAIYPAVRDEGWETIAPHIEDEVVENDEKAFRVSYTAFYEQEGIQFKAEISIAGSGDSILFQFSGMALTSFKKNRIGLCVLHPVDACTGREVVVTRPDGTSYTAPFPSFISPHQPFKDIQKMEWVIDDSHLIQLQFEGDIFETEDQRNWTDYSYKTYSTPLEKPFPALIEKGTRIEQQIAVTIIKQKASKKAVEATLPSDNREVCPVPLLGYSLAGESLPMANGALEGLKQMPFNYFEQALNLSLPTWRDELEQTVAAVQPLRTTLALTILFTQSFEKECKELITALKELLVKPSSLLPLHHDYRATPHFLLAHIYPAMKTAFPEMQIGFGSDKFFAELNRNRPPSTGYDFVAFNFYPQVHASDTRTIIENLQSLPQVMQSIAQFTGAPVFISPFSFGPLNKPPDGRLYTALGAAWFLLCLKNLSRASRLTFSGLGPDSVAEERQSPLLDVLRQLKRFRPVCIRHDEAQDEISFEDAAGDVLTYVVSAEFNNAIMLPQKES